MFATSKTVEPAKLAEKTLDDLRGFNPYNFLKHPAWYLFGLLLLLLTNFKYKKSWGVSPTTPQNILNHVLFDLNFLNS